MYLIMELKEMMKKLSEAVCDLRLKGIKNNPLIAEVNELLVKDNHSKLLNAYNSFYVKDGETEYASVKYNGIRYIVIKTKSDVGYDDIAIYAFDREGLNSNPLIPKYITTNGVSYDIHDCDNECIDEIMDYIITFLNNLSNDDLSKTNIKPDICNIIHNITNYIVIAKTEDFNQFLFDKDESNNIFAADKRFDDALEKANKPEVTKEDVKKLADELADNIMLAATKNEPTTCEVEPDVQLKDVFNKELQHVPMPDIESVNDHDNTIIKMTKAVKNKNFKKEFWDDNIIFSLKDKKFNKFLNRLYNVLTKGYKGGVYHLSTNDGGESFSWESIASVESNIGLGFIALTYNNNFNINISASKSEKSKYINMDIYQGSSGNHAAVIATIKFNLTNRYFYYNMRQFNLLFEAISAIVHPALVFYYSDPKIMKMYLNTIFFEYGFINYIEKIEEEHQKAEALDKARKDLKKDEKKRKKAEKKAAKKEKKSKKESKEETK